MIDNEFSSFSILVSSSTIASSMDDEESFDMKNTNRKNLLKHHQTSSPSSYTSSLSNTNINKLSSFKSKLKSKILVSKRKDKKCKRLVSDMSSKKKRNNLTEGASIEWSLALFNCNKLEKPIEKEDLGSLVATIYKIMDKSLCWLKLKSKSKIKKIKNSKMSNYNSQLTEEYFNYDTVDEEDASLYEPYNFVYTNATCESTSNQIEESFVCIKNSTNNSNNHKFIIHSTPQPNLNKIYNHFSPIICSSSIISRQFSTTSTSSFLSSHSTPIKSSNHSNHFNSSAGPFRLSFGVTSSPMSIAGHQNDIDKEYLSEQNYFDNNIYYDSDYESKYYNNFTNENESMVLQKKLIDRLNDIKQNVRMRNIQKITNQNSISINDRSDCKVKIKTKSKKLQKIFQSKLQKQLKEIKKWQTKVVKNNSNHYNESKSVSKSRKSIITSTYSSLAYVNQNNVTCSCNNSYNKILIDQTKNLNNNRYSIYYDKLNYYKY